MMSKFPVYPEAKLLIESFEDVKNNGISTFDSDISSLLWSIFDYKKGREMCKEYLWNMSTSAPDIEKQLKCIPVTNILLTSLLDVIPSWVKLDWGMKITYYGIYFQSLISGPEIYARYSTQIHSFSFLSFHRLIITDIFAETERMSYFLKFFEESLYHSWCTWYYKRYQVNW